MRALLARGCQMISCSCLPCFILCYFLLFLRDIADCAYSKLRTCAGQTPCEANMASADAFKAAHSVYYEANTSEIKDDIAQLVSCVVSTR